MMRVIRVIVAVAMLVLAVPAPAATAVGELPVTGTVMGQHGPPDFEATGCPEGSAWRFPSAGTGELAPFGAVEYVLTQCSRFGTEPGSVLSNGTITGRGGGVSSSG